MRIQRLMGLGLIVTGITTAVAVRGETLAQPRPNFAGRWTLESSTPPGVAAVRPSLIVKHDAATITFGDVEGGHHTSTYTIDGQGHERMQGPVKSVSKASWEGRTLGIDRTDTLPSGLTRTYKQLWSLDTSGKLIIKSTNVIEGKEPLTLTNVYVKK